MSSLSTTKKILIGVIVLIVLVAGYVVFQGGDDKKSQALLKVSSGSEADALLGRELLSVLAELKSLKLDTTVFDSGAFTNLRNFGVEIAKQDVGRNNPFAPVGSLGGSGVSSPASQPTSKTSTSPASSASSRFGAPSSAGEGLVPEGQGD